MKEDKFFLTVVTADDKITFKPIELANNDGKVLWIARGVAVGDRVALNIGDTVPEGGKVRPLVEERKP
jgi:hypothetical protein